MPTPRAVPTVAPRDRRVRAGVLGLLGFAAVLAGADAARAGWQVTLRNGTVIESRYKPREAAWNRDKVLLLTDVGNWISLDRSDVQSVKNALDVAGFGRVINTTTVELGYVANDALTPEQIQEAIKSGGNAALLQMQALFGGQGQQQTQSQQNYSIQQFVEPNATQGIPIAFGTNSNFPTGSTGFGFPGTSTFPVPAPASPATPPNQ